MSTRGTQASVMRRSLLFAGLCVATLLLCRTGPAQTIGAMSSVVVYDHGKRIEISPHHALRDQLVAGCEELLRSADVVRKCFARPEEIRRIRTEGVAVEIHYGGPRVVVLTHAAADGRERKIGFDHLIVPVTRDHAGCCTTIYETTERLGFTVFRNDTRNPQDIADLLTETLGIRLESEESGTASQNYDCGP